MTIRNLKLFAIAITCVILVSSFVNTNENAEVPYPKGFRKWAHVKSGVILGGNPTFKKYGGYHHIYANEKAMEGFTTGIFPEGSQLVFDVIDMKNENNMLLETNRKFIDVMYKDASFSETGGWGYDEFEADTEVRASISATTCFNCHVKREKQGYVFSELRK